MDVRAATLADSTRIAELATELGYPTDAAAMQQRLTDLLTSADERVMVAIDGGVIGVIQGSLVTSIESDRHVEIRALVIDPASRGAGAGARLVAAVEAWARDRGCRRIRVRSRVEREGARRFYEREGFRVTKTQNAFEKLL